MPNAVIAFDFDPLLRVGDGVVRWETIGVAVAIFVALVIAGMTARRMRLREDDLLFVVLGVVPGAVIGGRLGYVLLDGRPGRWLHLAALPMLVVVAVGKLAMVLGGTGQGQVTSGNPATAYLGPGPWGSLGPALPSIPSQMLEGFATLALAAVFLAVIRLPLARRPDGRAFLIALAAWAAVRLIVAATWRDPTVLGPFRAAQLIALAILIGSLVLLAVLVARGGRVEPLEADPLDGKPQPA